MKKKFLCNVVIWQNLKFMFALLKSIYWPFFRSASLSVFAWIGLRGQLRPALWSSSRGLFLLASDNVVAQRFNYFSQVGRNVCRRLSTHSVMDLSTLEGGHEVTFILEKRQWTWFTAQQPWGFERFVIESFVAMTLLDFVRLRRKYQHQL